MPAAIIHSNGISASSSNQKNVGRMEASNTKETSGANARRHMVRDLITVFFDLAADCHDPPPLKWSAPIVRKRRI